MKVTLSRMKSGEYRLSTWWIKISLYHSYTMRKSRVGSCTSRIKRTIDLIYRSVFIKRYSYVTMSCTYKSRWTYTYCIHILIFGRCIRISCDRSKSIAHFLIPVWRCNGGYFSGTRLWRIRGFWLSKRGEIIHRAVYTSKDEKREESTEPFLLSILTLSWNEMFHKLYKKSKIIIAYKIPYVNTYFIFFIIVKYQFLEKVDFLWERGIF